VIRDCAERARVAGRECAIEIVCRIGLDLPHRVERLDGRVLEREVPVPDLSFDIPERRRAAVPVAPLLASAAATPRQPSRWPRSAFIASS